MAPGPPFTGLEQTDTSMTQPETTPTQPPSRLPVWTSPPWRLWPVLVPMLAVPAAYLLDATGLGHLSGRGVQETAALVLMLALSIVFLCREIHFTGTQQGIYVALALIAVWCLVWRRSLLGSLRRNGRRTRWVVMMMWAYAVAMLIQRRALRVLPHEDDLHVQMEEVAENIAHLFLIVLGLV
jgi:hypothetical protein